MPFLVCHLPIKTEVLEGAVRGLGRNSLEPDTSNSILLDTPLQRITVNASVWSGIIDTSPRLDALDVDAFPLPVSANVSITMSFSSIED